MVVKHVIDIDFVARNNTPVVHLTQYDDGLPLLVARTYQNGSPLVLSSEELTASLRFMKQDGNFVLSPGTITEKEISFKIPSSMTVFQGKYPGKVELKDMTGQVICSATIVFDIDRNPVQKDAVESDSDYKDYIDKVLGQIPGFDGYTKTEADTKFATKQYASTAAVNARNAPTIYYQASESGLQLDGEGKKRYFIDILEFGASILFTASNSSSDVEVYLNSPGSNYQMGDINISFEFESANIHAINFLNMDSLFNEFRQFHDTEQEPDTPATLYLRFISYSYDSTYVYCIKGWGDGPKIEIVQETGENTESVMSQYAVTEALANAISTAEAASAKLISSLVNQETIHITNAIGSSEVALQSGKRYFIEGTDASQSPQVTMVLNNVTAKTNIEVFCKFAHNVILALEHPSATLETYGTGDLETKIAALNEAARTGTGYLHLRFVGLQPNQCAVLISN